MNAKWLALATAVVLSVSSAALAQQTPAPVPSPAPSPAPSQGMGQGMMRGGDETRHQGMMRGHGMEMGGIMMGHHFCSNKEAMAPRILSRLESTIKPTDAQKPEMDALRTAATKAEGIMRAACPAAGDDDRSPPARLAQMEKNATAMAEALKTVRPAFDALYAKLDDKQRDRMRWSRGRH